MTSFEDEMMDVMNKAAIALLLSVGHRTKIFDIMAKLEPSTSQEIATAANLNEICAGVAWRSCHFKNYRLSPRISKIFSVERKGPISHPR